MLSKLIVDMVILPVNRSAPDFQTDSIFKIVLYRSLLCFELYYIANLLRTCPLPK